MLERLTRHQEEALIEYAKVDREGFIKLYKYYFPQIYSYVSWKVDLTEDREDIVSDIFMKVLVNLTKYTSQENKSFTSWIYTIAYRTVVDFYRKKGKYAALPQEFYETLESTLPLPAEIAENKMLLYQIRLEINKLPAKQCEILLMRFTAEMTNKEIALALNISEKSVSSQISRGITLLRKIIKK